jgi:hypothetical protein
MKLTTWVLAAALLVPSLAAADRNHGDRGERRARMAERFDANRDGQLDDQERGAMLAAKAERRAQMKQRFDANRDGHLDPREKQHAKTTRRAMRSERRAKRIARFIERFDRNRDGNVGPSEVPPEAMRRLKKLDRDGDGWVEPHETRPPAAGGRMRNFRAPPADDAPSEAPGATDEP